MKLKDYLINMGVKKKFFKFTPHQYLSDEKYGTYTSKIGFYKKELGFISNDLLSNFFIGKKFLSLKEVFPSNHNFTLTMPSVDPVRKTDPAMEPFIFEGGSFEKAIDSRKKAIVDLSRLSKKKGEDTDKKEILKILKKYNLVELKQDFNDDVRYFANDHLYDVYFEHDYEDFKLPNFPGRGPRTNDNYFLVKTRIGKKYSRIFYIDTGNLMYVDYFIVGKVD